MSVGGEDMDEEVDDPGGVVPLSESVLEFFPLSPFRFLCYGLVVPASFFFVVSNPTRMQ